jgi:holin-like protein
MGRRGRRRHPLVASTVGSRQVSPVLNALTLLVSCQFVGEVLARGIGLPIPGPVLGLLLLLAGLIVRERLGHGGPGEGLKTTANGLLGNLGLLFVPAGVGVVTQLGALGGNFVPVAVAMLVSTFVGLMVTGWIMQRFAGPGDEER